MRVSRWGFGSIRRVLSPFGIQFDSQISTQRSEANLLRSGLLLSDTFSEHIFSTAVAPRYTRLLSFSCAPLTRTCLAVRKEVVVKRISLLVALICCVLAARISAAAESHTWTVRAGDSFDIIASTLEIPKEEIKKQNPGISESNLQIGQKIKLPLRAYRETKALEQELIKRG